VMMMESNSLCVPAQNLLPSIRARMLQRRWTARTMSQRRPVPKSQESTERHQIYNRFIVSTYLTLLLESSTTLEVYNSRITPESPKFTKKNYISMYLSVI
jgi:hypothetical protein